MSHVDEGELTAYADGAWAPHEADAQRIAQHLAECANCRNRLALAQSLSARASQILAVAAPVQVSTPPFEQLRAEAAPRRQWTAPPMAWAATVILALGIGWFGRGAVPRVDTRSAVMDGSAEPSALQEQDAALVAPSVEASASVPTLTPAPTPASPRGRAVLGSAGAGAATTEVVGQVASAPAEITATDQVAAEEGARAEARDMATGKSVAASVPASPPPPAAQMANTSLAERSADGVMRRMAAPAEARKAGGIEHIAIAEAERRGLELHLVPELEVLRVGVGSKGLIIEQKLGDGKMLTITQTTVSPDRRSDTDGPVVVMRNGARVTLAGPVALDSLRALAQKIR